MRVCGCDVFDPSWNHTYRQKVTDLIIQSIKLENFDKAAAYYGQPFMPYVLGYMLMNHLFEQMLYASHNTNYAIDLFCLFPLDNIIHSPSTVLNSQNRQYINK